MDQQSYNLPEGPNWKSSAPQNPSKSPLPDAAEASGQPKKLGQLDMSLSMRKSQSTNDTTQSINKEISTQNIDCFLNSTNQDNESTAQAINSAFYSNYLADDPFSAVLNHAINMTAQENDMNFGKSFF